jgi:PAS domain S-box-containing protein
MKDQDKTKQQLIDELKEMRQQVTRFEGFEEERKRLVEELQQSEEVRVAISNATPDFVAVVDNKLVISHINEPMAQRFGKRPEDLIGTYGLDLLPPELAASRKQYFDKVLQTGQACRWEDENRGMYFDNIAFSVREDNGKVTRVALIARDITERKRVEEALRESEEKYRNVVERANDGICIIQDRLVKYANLRQAEMWGGAVEEIINKPFTDYVYPDDLRLLVERYNRRMAGEQVPSVYEASLRRKDGSRVYAELNIGLINYLGKPAELVITRDITERKQAAEALQQSEENFRNSLDDSPLGIRIVTSEGETLYANKAIMDIYGYSSLQELKATPTKQRYTPQSYAEHVERREKRKKGEYVPSTYEISIVRKDGEVRVLQVFRKTVRWAGEEQFQVIYQDITEHRQLEEERRRIERLESLGTLAGGIAHDFNNLLTGIMGNISLVRGYLEPDGKAAERLLEAERASLRARDLTQHLLTFARGGEPIKETTAIGRLVSDSANFALRGSKSSCIVDIPENLWQAEIDRGQINEVIHNLVINADEAMPGGGVVNISARNRVLKEGNVLSLPKGDYIKVSIEDYGVGIPGDDLPRIFEPYFTTKKEGSGLGLATTYSIIQNHKGRITVDSVPGERTTFDIYLPATRRPSASLEEEPDDIQVPVTGKILIMDDEEAIRRLLHRALSEVGHDVTMAVDGVDVIEQYIQAKEKGRLFDLVILDLTVPGGMGGVEAMKRLLEINPKAKAIVSSGYSTDPIMAGYRKYGFTAVIAKPYRVRELRRMIRDILQGRNR